MLPANISPGAVKVIGIRGTGPWQWCEMTTSANVHCEIYDVKGGVLAEDNLVAYSGSLPRSVDDIRISPRGNAQWIELDNETILIPEGDLEKMTRFLVGLLAKGKSCNGKSLILSFSHWRDPKLRPLSYTTWTKLARCQLVSRRVGFRRSKFS